MAKSCVRCRERIVDSRRPDCVHGDEPVNEVDVSPAKPSEATGRG